MIAVLLSRDDCLESLYPVDGRKLRPLKRRLTHIKSLDRTP